MVERIVRQLTQANENLTGNVLKTILKASKVKEQILVVGDTANIDFDTIPSTFSSIPLFRYFFRYRYLSLLSGNKIHHTIENRFVPQQLIVLISNILYL